MHRLSSILLLRTLLAYISFSAELAATAAKAPLPQKQNVVLVITDDQGYGDLSCHGNPVLKTL